MGTEATARRVEEDRGFEGRGGAASAVEEDVAEGAASEPGRCWSSCGEFVMASFMGVLLRGSEAAQVMRPSSAR